MFCVQQEKTNVWQIAGSGMRFRTQFIVNAHRNIYLPEVGHGQNPLHATFICVAWRQLW
jgi:hypothetical protein